VIEVVEQLGSEIVLDMKVGEGVMVASVEPNVRVKVRDKLRLAVDPSRLHIFDVKTETAIYPATSFRPPFTAITVRHPLKRKAGPVSTYVHPGPAWIWRH